MLLAVAVAVALVPAAWVTPAVASCAAPQLAVADDTRVAPGEPVEVFGAGFQDGCDDAVGVSTTAFGCSREVREEVHPASDVTLRLEQDGRSWVLGVADADASYGVVWRARLPSDVMPGRARLVADASEPLRLRVVALTR